MSAPELSKTGNKIGRVVLADRGRDQEEAFMNNQIVELLGHIVCQL